ncbi:MAG: DUF4118 domain-containing protein [Acidobacteriia bacterium]|nr:DUF4118 domain-containing protein [Terriglobia bacterium]
MAEPEPRRRKRGHWFSWVALSVACLAIDYETGPVIEFPVVYLAPISLASWFSGRVWGLALAVVLPLCRLYFRTIWNPPWSFQESSINAAIRITVFASFAWLIDRTARQMRELKHTYLLESMLGVCSVCKNIRNPRSNEWEPLDAYVKAHPEDFRPDVCPGCGAQVREALFDRR